MHLKRQKLAEIPSEEEYRIGQGAEFLTSSHYLRKASELCRQDLQDLWYTYQLEMGPVGHEQEQPIQLVERCD